MLGRLYSAGLFMIARGVNRMPVLVALGLMSFVRWAGAGAEEHGATATAAAEPVDDAVVARLRDEGFRRFKVMEFARVLTDVYGPRYANSPSYDGAARWERRRRAGRYRDYNVIAELAGGDLAHEVVMIGGHLDAEAAGTGATDNAAGSAIVIEAMRLLRAIDARPRRTIRAALWGAEESGLLGSRGYVRQHFGDPESAEKPAAHANLSVYFNVDWYGRFRGIYLQGNDEARPIFEAWMAPFHDVGMSWIVPGNTCCTDHMAFLETGLQGFQWRP